MDYIFDYELLCQRMEEYRYSKNKLANAIPMSRTSLHKKMKSESYFTQSEIKKICYLLNIPLSKVGKIFFSEDVQKTEFMNRRFNNE